MMIDRQVPTWEEVYDAVFGLFERARGYDKKLLWNAFFPSDPELDPKPTPGKKFITSAPTWEYSELLRFIETLEQLIAQHKDSTETEIRLRLMGYCHIMEADFPLAVLWNLLRILARQEPTWTFAVQDPKGKSRVCEYPSQKISAIVQLATYLKEPIGDCLNRIWYPIVRNAFSHSQYSLMSGYMIRTKGLSPVSRKSRNEICDGRGNPSFDDIRALYQGASALLNSFNAGYEGWKS